MNSALAFLLLILVVAVIMFTVISNAARPKGRRAAGRHTGRGRASTPQLSRTELAARWATIRTMAGPSGGGNGLRNAIAEADKLLDHVLKQQGLPGANMGDRLKAARSRFEDDRAAYDALWRAHKLRNALAHEIGFDLVPSQAREALTSFERALRILEAL